MQTELSYAQQKKVALKVAQQQSREHQKKSLVHTNEILSNGHLSLTGHHRRIQKRPSLPALLAACSPTTIATLVAFDDLASVNLGALKHINIAASQPNFYANNDNENLCVAFNRDDVSSIEVTAEISEALNQQVSHQFNAVRRVADGTYMGPLRQETQLWRDVYQSGHINKDEFTARALEIRGIVFSRDDNLYAVSQQRLENLKNSFSNVQIPAMIPSPSTTVCVFGQSAKDKYSVHNYVVTPDVEKLTASQPQLKVA